MNDSELSQLGRNQLVRDVEDFCRRVFSAKRRAAIAQAREKNRRELLEAALELRLDDVSAVMGLPATHPLVIAFVLNTSARREPDEERFHSYIGEGFDW